MARKRQSSTPPPGPPSFAFPPAPDGWITCPFVIITDTREQDAYHFLNIRSDADNGRRPMRVNTVRSALATGDYGIFGLANRVTVERKSKADLYGSISKRDNFEGRLARMSTFDHAVVVVEAEFSEIRTAPPPFAKLSPKSVCRTILAWTQRYQAVHWWFMPGRGAAEAWTFRILERYWKDHRDGVVDAVATTLDGRTLASRRDVDRGRAEFIDEAGYDQGDASGPEEGPAPPG